MTPGTQSGEQLKRMIRVKGGSLCVILNVVGTNSAIASFHAHIELGEYDGREFVAYTNTFVTIFFTMHDATIDLENDPELPTIWVGDLECYKEDK